MKRHGLSGPGIRRVLLLVFAVLLPVVAGCQIAEIQNGGGTPALPAAPPKALPYIVGADISWVQAAEDRGLRFGDQGQQKDILAILKDHGFNFIRLRVFVDPTRPTPSDRRAYSTQGYCDLPHTIAMGKRVKDAGMGLLIDFHYSDSWADPGKQHTPSAWLDLSFDELVVKTREYARDSVRQLAAAGAKPDMVQIGNEITPGMMTDRGGSSRDWQALARLLKAGIAGVKEVDPHILTVLHIDRGGDNATARRWVDAAIAHEVEFDVLGLSCYTRWHGPPEQWKANVEDLQARYPHLKFLIAEVGYEIREATDIMRSVPDGRGLGTFVWEPTSNLNGQALFDNQGRVIPDKMAAYDEVVEKYGIKRLP